MADYQYARRAVIVMSENINSTWKTSFSSVSLLEYFKINYGVNTIGEILWSHAVNSQEKLKRNLNNPQIMFIESDIQMSSKDTLIAAHPPETESDLSFELLLNAIRNSKQGIKLDFKDPEAVVPCLLRLQHTPLQQPVLLNADVIQGNHANPPKFNASEFVTQCTELYPQGILSLGWTTIADPDSPYSQAEIDKMMGITKKLQQVTFPVRACLLPKSWRNIQILLQHDGFSLTIWNNESVPSKLQEWIRRHTDPAKTFYDFIDENREPLRFWE